MTKSEALKILDFFNYRKNKTQVFCDCVEYLALKTAAVVDPLMSKESRQTLKNAFNGYTDEEKEVALEFSKAIELILIGMTKHFDDYLGEMYMELLGKNSKNTKGQFFTPYHISQFMSAVTLGDLDKLKEQEKITINDPCCGAGGLCVAAVEYLDSKNINYLQRAVFYANDIDLTCVYMTYLQLNFCGAAAVVEHKDTLTQKVYNSFRTLGYTLTQPQNSDVME